MTESLHTRRFVCVLVLAFLSPGPALTTDGDTAILIRNVRVWNGISDRLLENQSVLVEGDRIARAVGISGNQTMIQRRPKATTGREGIFKTRAGGCRLWRSVSEQLTLTIKKFPARIGADGG